MESFKSRMTLRQTYLTVEASRQLLPSCIVKVWLPMTGSVLLSTHSLETGLAFLPAACMGFAGNLRGSVPTEVPSSNRSFLMPMRSVQMQLQSGPMENRPISEISARKETYCIAAAKANHSKHLVNLKSLRSSQVCLPTITKRPYIISEPDMVNAMSIWAVIC